MCDCIEAVSKQLKPHNAGLVINLIGPARACVDLYKLDDKQRRRLPIMEARFCPFCGRNYDRIAVEQPTPEGGQ